MKEFLKALGISTLAAAMLFGIFSIAPRVQAGVSCSVPFVFSNGTTADATQVNANFTSIINCFNTTASAGANSDITSLSGLTTPLSAVQGGSQFFWGGTSSGTNTINVTTVRPTVYANQGGSHTCFIPGGTNTGPATLTINGVGTLPIQRLIQTASGITGSANLVGGELVAGAPPVCVLSAASFYTIINQKVDYVGEIKDFGYTGCPTGWAEANGSNNTISIASFPDINNAFGTTWGTNGGFTVMPDLRGRTTFSRDTLGTRLTTDQNGALAGNTVGTMGGVQNQTLTGAQLPATTLTGSVTPTLTANTAVTLSGTHSFSASANFPTASTSWVDQLINTGSTVHGPVTASLGSVSSTSYTPSTVNGSDFTVNTAGSNYTVSTVNGSSFSFGSGNSHPVTPPLGVVTKCVKL